MFFHREKGGHAGIARAPLCSVPACCHAAFPGHGCALPCQPALLHRGRNAEMPLVQLTFVICAGDCKRSWCGWLMVGSNGGVFQLMLTRAKVKGIPQPFAHSPSSFFLSKQVGFFSFRTKFEAKNCFPSAKVQILFSLNHLRLDERGHSLLVPLNIAWRENLCGK